MGIPELHRQKFDRLAPEQQRNLGGLGPVELLSRLLYVEHLDKVAAAMDAPTARAYSALATRVLSAAPRAEVERRVADLRKTASALAHDASMRTGRVGRDRRAQGRQPRRARGIRHGGSAAHRRRGRPSTPHRSRSRAPRGGTGRAGAEQGARARERGAFRHALQARHRREVNRGRRPAPP
jgi:hypothetical protein